MHIIFDGKQFDILAAQVVGSADEHQEAVVFKDEASVSGKPCVMVTYLINIVAGDGIPPVPVRVGMILSVRMLLQIAAAARGRYSHVAGLEDSQPIPKDAPPTIAGHVDGVGYNAVIVERAYVGVIEVPGEPPKQVIATSEFEIRKIAEGVAAYQGGRGT